MSTAAETNRRIIDELSPVLGDAEARSAAAIIMEDVARFDRKKLFTDGSRTLTDFTEAKINSIVSRIAAGEPVQYAVGTARFYGMDFKVTPDVLIPRPETEGLVDRVVDAAAGRSDLRILDVCCGSGCIAIALARSLAFARVTGVDISEKALEVARENAKNLDASGVVFEKADALKPATLPEGPFDFIVSNPPYVAESEKKDMDARILDYEPAMALFVPDADPVCFYCTISEYAFRELTPGGMLWFEINPLFAQPTLKAMEDAGFAAPQLERDFRGNVRYAFAKK